MVPAYEDLFETHRIFEFGISYFSYRYCKNKPYPKSRFCRGVPGKKCT